MYHNFEETLDAYLVAPIQRVIFKKLNRVKYWILAQDEAVFDVTFPNSTGVSVIEVFFDGCILVIQSNWRPSLRSATSTHIEASVHEKVSVSPLLESSELLLPVDASNSPSWKPLMNEVVDSIDVVGFERSPQGIRLWSGAASVTLVVGTSGNVSEAGDGDEILIFNDSEWHDIQLSVTWEKLWSSQSHAKSSD